MITINISWGDSYFSSELQKKSFADEPRAIEFLRRNCKKMIINIINLAGFGLGIGSGRSSGYGRYKVVDMK